MKKKVFHQFIYMTRGSRNTAIIDCLTGHVFQVENEYIDQFEKGQYEEIQEFIRSLEAEKLIIEVDEGRWIPRTSAMTGDDEEFRLELEIEEGVDIGLTLEKFQNFEISQITFYGTVNESHDIPFANVVNKQKDFARCLDLSKVDSDFGRINEQLFHLNLKYNSCWQRKMAITRDGKIRPCIYSELIFGDLEEGCMDTMLEKAKEYWGMAKDKIEKCKICEFRYACFDCREIARREGGTLFSPNPHCKYDPLSGKWKE